MNSQPANHTKFIKEEAARLGFYSCGISKAGFLEEEAPLLEQWLSQNKHGEMGYMANHFDMRLDPRKLVDGAKSVVSLLYNYFPETTQPEEADYKISKYAYGRDYHKVIKAKLKEFMISIQDEIGAVNGRAFVDSAPVMDKAWAKKSGLGWMGKNANIITKTQGSFFFIAELIIDLELEYDSPAKDYCGTCTKCIDACPTDAIVQPYVVDGSKCISYFTIELKKEIPEEYHKKLGNWVFGCDICQDVCPWNRFSKPNQEKDFLPSSEFLKLNKKDWEEITEDIFNTVFEGSPLKRTGYAGLIRNVKSNNQE
ncbi:MAG: tRNA epoxyqueuosine(34) reductase QueG [Bacteroidetes bacterium]|nr:tRNA epoxyqueuosine(34) reductase QueG [Bacteroidota bacterium]